ncbi:hypothetical protein QQF64_018208, partial [Cirrhinus molitorella]
SNVSFHTENCHQKPPMRKKQKPRNERQTSGEKSRLRLVRCESMERIKPQ